MSLLFKTALIHLKKNFFVTGVLAFFVTSGAAVMSSSHLLTSNLHKGYQEINYDSNPHDLILLSSARKPTPRIHADVKYDIRDIQELSVNRSLKWSWNSLKNEFWSKSNDYDTILQAVTENYKPSSSSSSGIQPKFKKLPTLNFSIPNTKTENLSWANKFLMCASSSSFFAHASADVTWMDTNNALYDAARQITGPKDQSTPIRHSCGSSILILDAKHPSNGSFMDRIYKYYETHISPNASGEFNNEETFEIHRQTQSFNPKYFWKRDISDKNIYMNLFEEDYYVSLNIPFKVLLDGDNIAQRLLALASNLTKSEIYYQLDNKTRVQVYKFLSNKRFQTLPITITVSNLARLIYDNHTDFVLPMIPGMTYRETFYMMLKLVLWDYLHIPAGKDKPIKNLRDLYVSRELIYNDEVKQQLLTSIQGWDEHIKGIEDWKPFGVIPSPTKVDKQENYVFSTLFASKHLSELKNQFGNESEDWKPPSSPIIPSGAITIYKDSDTLIKNLKNVLVSWIKGEYYNKDNNTSTRIIPAFNRNSKTNLDNEKSISDNDKFSDQKSFYKTHPKSFEDTYNTMMNMVRGAFTHFLDSANILNTKSMKKFLNESEIFSLSFLMQNFVYDPHKYLGQSESQRKKYQDTVIPKGIKVASSPNPPYKKSDFFPSINYHKSLVVTNSGNTSSKLNDSTKTWHSFKIVTQERKDNSYVNTIKILSGNPLFNAPQDYLSTLMGYKAESRNLNIHNVLRRMNHSKVDYANDAKKRYEYLSYPFDDPWQDQHWTKPLHPHTTEGFRDVGLPWSNIWGTSHNSGLTSHGARVSVLLNENEVLHLTRTFKVVTLFSGLPLPSYIDQSSAFFTIVSPFYAQQNNIKPISDAQYAHFKKLVEGHDTTQEDWEREYSYFVMHPDNHDHIINVNGNKLIVVGIGLSPDMILPSHAPLNLIPNKEKEAILYVDKYGYNNIKFNSLSTWDEQYLSIAYPQAVKDMGLEEDYKNQMSEYIKSYLSSSGSNSQEDQFQLTSAKDSNPFSGLNLVFLRTQYSDHLMTATNLLFNIIFAFVIAVVLFTVWILIKQYTTSSIKTFGVFVANGVQRLQIILNSSIFILLPAILGVTLGYLISLPLQPVLFGLVSGVWYLSPVFSGFSVSQWLFYVLLTGAVLGPISWVTSFLIIRRNVSNLMKVNPTFRQNKLIQFISHRFHSLSSLWKFRLSIIMNTLGRGLLLSSVASLMFIFTSFLFNNLNQFKHVSDMELQTKDYGYSIFFNTPSEQSGQPYLTSYSNMGDTYVDGTPHIKNVFAYDVNNATWKKETLDFNHSNPEIVSASINGIYDPKEIQDYLATCSKTITSLKNWRPKLGLIDLNYIQRSVEENIYNKYLFAKKMTKKNGQIDCNQWIVNSFTQSDREFITHSTEKDSIWFRSKPGVNNLQSSSSTSFSPSFSPQNKLGILGHYVPVVNESREGNSKYQMEKYGSEPLFKPLIEYYKTKKPIPTTNLSQDNEYKAYEFLGETKDTPEKVLDGSTKLLNGDFVQFEGKHKHPTLSRLYKDHSNYWLMLYHDYANIKTNPSFLKNRVILPFLFNHTWSIPIAGKTIELNPWNDFKDFLSKYSTELVSALENNYFNFINEILKSRYGKFFISRFMSKHSFTQHSTQQHVPGKTFWGKPTWQVSKNLLAEHNKDLVEEGLYWINPDKLLHLHDIMGVNRFFIFRPDFLYFFYAVMKDPSFLRKNIAPIKVSFNQNLYIPDYDNPFKEWTLNGDWTTDDSSKLGITASSQTPNYENIPNGDQTYTYIKSIIPSLNDKWIDIFGLKQDTRGSYIKLKKNGKIINNLLYQKKFQSGEYPVIVNQFTAKQMSLDVGSTFTAQVHNTTDRYTRRANNLPKKTVSFKVVGIYDSYFQNSFYVSQKNANEILGLNPEYGYNGLYTKQFSNNDLPMQLSQSISGFSALGLYSFVKVEKTADDFLSFLRHAPKNAYDSIFKQPSNKQFILNSLGWKGGELDHEKTAELLHNIYDPQPALTASVINVNPAGFVNNFMFRAVPDLIMSVINLFIMVFTPLLVLSLLVITKLIIEDLRNILTILNLLGFTYSENSTTILLYLGLVLTLSTILAIPLSSTLISLYATGIFDALSIYLPIGLRVDYSILSFAILLSMFGFSYWVSLKKIKSLYLPVEMKALNG